MTFSVFVFRVNIIESASEGLQRILGSRFMSVSEVFKEFWRAMVRFKVAPGWFQQQIKGFNGDSSSFRRSGFICVRRF